MRFCACLAFVALLAGCSYSVEGSGSPSPSAETAPAPEPEPAVDEINEGEAKPPPLKASDIKGVSVVVDGVTQAIAEGVVTVTNGAVGVTLRRKGDTGQTQEVVFVSVDRAGTGCSRRDDHYNQGVTYYPRSTTLDTDPLYSSPLSLGCGLNILELDKGRGGRVVGIYDGELKREWGSAQNPERIRVVIKFNVAMPATE